MATSQDRAGDRKTSISNPRLGPVAAFTAAVNEARRLYRDADKPDAFWEQGGRVDAATARRIGHEANIDAAQITLGYAETSLTTLTGLGLPESHQAACESALRICDCSDASWAAIEQGLRSWADGLQQQEALPATDDTFSNRIKSLAWLVKAIFQVQDHPDWSDARIARDVGVSPGTLSRSTEFKTAAKEARGDKTTIAKGNIKVDPDTGLHDVEAIAHTTPVEDKSDQGLPISGSKHYREYCHKCGEAMRVPQSKVGTQPLCDDCQDN